MRERSIRPLKRVSRLSTVIAAATAIIPVSATAAEQNDSTSKQLQEVVVEGRNTYTTRHGVTYVTNRNQRNGAANAYDLLGRLGMTEIQVDPRTNEVTTNSSTASPPSPGRSKACGRPRYARWSISRPPPTPGSWESSMS